MITKSISCWYKIHESFDFPLFGDNQLLLQFLTPDSHETMCSDYIRCVIQYSVVSNNVMEYRMMQ